MDSNVWIIAKERLKKQTANAKTKLWRQKVFITFYIPKTEKEKKQKI